MSLSSIFTSTPLGPPGQLPLVGWCLDLCAVQPHIPLWTRHGQSGQGQDRRLQGQSPRRGLKKSSTFKQLFDLSSWLYRHTLKQEAFCNPSYPDRFCSFVFSSTTPRQLSVFCSAQLNTHTNTSLFLSFVHVLLSFSQIIECRSPLCISIASQHSRNKTIMYISKTIGMGSMGQRLGGNRRRKKGWIRYEIRSRKKILISTLVWAGALLFSFSSLPFIPLLTPIPIYLHLIL